MVILTVHLLLAAIYSLSILCLAIAAAIRKATPRLKIAAITSFTTTISTGVVLVMVSPKAMAQFCTSTMIASIFGAVAWVLYKQRVTAMQPEKSKIY